MIIEPVFNSCWTTEIYKQNRFYCKQLQINIFFVFHLNSPLTNSKNIISLFWEILGEQCIFCYHRGNKKQTRLDNYNKIGQHKKKLITSMNMEIKKALKWIALFWNSHTVSWQWSFTWLTLPRNNKVRLDPNGDMTSGIPFEHKGTLEGS